MSRPPATAWLLPDVAGPVVASRGRSTSANDLSKQVMASQQRAFEEARQLGFAKGMIEANAVRDQLLREATMEGEARTRSVNPSGDATVKVFEWKVVEPAKLKSPR